MPNRASFLDTPFRFRRSIHLLASLCSLLVLAACGKEREFGSGGGGTGPTSSSSSGASTSSSSNASSSSSNASSSSTGGGCMTPDPDCECVNGQVVARDVDMDGVGTRLCEAAPGIDCDDGDMNFVQNECGGCNKSLGGKVGDPCQSCGVFQCLGDSALQCVPPNPPTRQCMGKTVQVCSAGGLWMNEKTCVAPTPGCVAGVCTECQPGTFKCGTVQGTPVVIKCEDTGSWESSWSISCSSLQSCHAPSGTCVGLFHPRDLDFDVPALLREMPGAPPPGLPTRDVLDLAVGIAFT